MSNKSWLPETPLRPLGEHVVGAGHPVYITGEIGINHDGELATAIALIDEAADAGCDAALVASALHDGRLTRADIEACRSFTRDRR